MHSERSKHPYHLVDPSPWPLLAAFFTFCMLLGAIFLFAFAKGKAVLSEPLSWLIMIFGILGLLYVMFVWWRDVINEAEVLGKHTTIVQIHHRYGIIFFILSELMFFVGWFWAYFDSAAFIDSVAMTERLAVTGGTWPPKGIDVPDPFGLPLANTLILLLSGTTVTWAHASLIDGKRVATKYGLILTVLLGLLFTAVQIYEYSHINFSYSGNIFGSTFFLATGFHGFHVIVGTIFLFVCLLRVIKGHFRSDHHVGFEGAVWYWHFVDVVWIFLFVFVYVMPYFMAQHH